MPDKPLVSLAALDNYDNQEVVNQALQRALSPFGGMGALVKPGQRVLLKPNLVAPAKPEQAVTTHPAIVRAVVQSLHELGCQIKIGDGPGVGTSTSVGRLAGMVDIAREGHAELVDFEKTRTYSNEHNHVLKNLDLTDHLADADVLITLPKLKTHSQMAYTCALKNQYGLIPGMAKAQFHFRFQNRDRMADLIVDINRTAAPKLAIVDAVVGMEGPGPNGGTPRKIGLLIVGTDLAAVDTVAATIIGLPLEDSPILMAARRTDFGATRLEDIAIVGEDINRFKIPDFDLIKAPTNIMRILPLPDAVLKYLRRQIVPSPHVLTEKCIKCLRCKNGCPIQPPAIDPTRPPDKILDTRNCIRCYCCHEFCPAKAIVLKRSRLDRICHIQAVLRVFHKALGWFLSRCPMKFK